jgi:hypothetical protein
VTQAVAKPSDVPLGARPGELTPTTGTPTLAQNPSAGGTNSWQASETPTPAAGGDTRWPPDRSTVEPMASDGNRSDALNKYSSSGPAGFTPDTRMSDTRTPAQTVSQQSRVGRPGSPLDFSLLPAAVRPRMVASDRFELEYEIESVGPSGVAKVELWGTRDGGRTWSDFAADTDNRSPVTATVNGEGIYGFRILVRSGSGYGGRPPAEGDLPDVWVGVDLTKPTCKITGTEVSPDSTELVIRWEASDDVLDPRPITLLFAESTAGPWTPIASGLENTGSYRWKLDNRVPPQVVLRVEARDEAGNVGSADLAEPVALDRHRPEGRIRGIRPIAK